LQSVCIMEDVDALIGQLDVNVNGVTSVVKAMKSLKVLVGKEPEMYQPKVISRADFILESSLRFHEKLNAANEDSEKEVRLMWQFLHNVCVRQPEFCQRLWVRFSDVIVESLTNKGLELKTKNVISAVVLQLLINYGFQREATDQLDNHMCRLFDNLLSLIRQDPDAECEFPLLAAKKIIRQRVDRLSEMSERLEPEGRRLLFDILLEEKSDDMTVDLLRFVTSEFKVRSTALFVTMKKSERDVDPREVMQLLELIVGSTKNPDFLGTVLQSDKSLLIDAVYLLRMVHEAGKQNAEGMFGIRPALEDVRDEERMAATQPVFGLKRDLVRLIANLVHEHRENQDEVREHQGVELLLDCSQADGKNPLIRQWVVFAIRNLCLGNLENQEVVRSIERKGKINADMMNDIGVQIKEL